MNAVNDGSFAVTAARKEDSRRGSERVIPWLLEQEDGMGLNTTRPISRIRGARVPAPCRPSALAADVGSRRQEGDWLRGIYEGAMLYCNSVA
jgi:hypothetical protein